jgi:aspartate racemase
MGPEATMLLQGKILNAVPARDDSDHVPLIIDMNPRVPSRIAHLIEGTGKDPGPTLAAMAARLQHLGCAALAMPCNTAHHYADAITSAVEIPFLNMIDLAVNYALRTVGKGGRVGILGSPALQRVGIFERAFSAKGISVHWPNRDDALLTAIKSIKSVGPEPRARSALREASTVLDSAGVDLQFIACSEFSLITGSVVPDANVVDTVDLLAKEIVGFSTAV